jgi:hypothetical protein
MSVELQLDWVALDNFNRQMDKLKKDTGRSAISALKKVGMRIKTTAQLRLKGQFHVDTSRLINSIYLKAKIPVEIQGNSRTYQDDPKNAKTESKRKEPVRTYESDLKSVSLTDTEIAVGTNVEYGEDVERKWPYLYWAINNVEIEKTMVQEMRDAVKFGAGVKEQTKSK